MTTKPAPSHATWRTASGDQPAMPGEWVAL